MRLHELAAMLGDFFARAKAMVEILAELRLENMIDSQIGIEEPLEKVAGEFDFSVNVLFDKRVAHSRNA